MIRKTGSVVIEPANLLTRIMATIIREFFVSASAETAWSAIRDYGAVHHRLAPGLVTDVRLEDDVRIVSLSTGLVLRELLVTIDDEARRLVYASTGGRAKHHNASLQVFPSGPNECRIVWLTDVLPAELVEPISGLIEQAVPIMQRTLEQAAQAG